MDVMLKITLKDLQNLKDNDGITLVNGVSVTYTNGYQVATEGIETTDVNEALETIKKFGGNAGVWYSKKVFYVDKSHHVITLREALKMGRKYNQQSILKWNGMELIWL